NPYYAFWTLTSGNGTEYIVRGDQVVDIRDFNSVIPDGGFVLSATGRSAWLMSGLKVGNRLKVVQTMGPIWDKVVNAIGAGPCLVKNAEIYVTTLGEEFGSDVAGGRAPRTAIGITKEGKVLLVVVDGRRRTSVGFTLLELAQFMLDQGAVEAMNLDGGGSSEMIVGNQIMNEPSDGRERRMGAGLAVIKTKPAK
ncbi:MAG: PhosphodieSPTER glycosidase, partial [Firmicutes bacterium]|nr:PhosphodieSPTER glycosidase [Bacillota bacterium]